MVSKLILVTLCLAAAVAVVSARPRFLAIPLEDVEFVNRPVYIPHHRITRRAAQNDEPEPAADNSRSGYGSGYGGNDYVDYGAYTGGYGAFGWYTDHPVGGGYGYGR